MMNTLAPPPLPGVFLFQGYSRKDLKILMEGREEVSDRVPNTDEEEDMEVTSTVQQAVSHYTSNNNKVRRIVLSFIIMFNNPFLDRVHHISHRKGWRKLCLGCNS